MSTPEVQIGDNVYQIGKLAAMTQFHCVRRIGPVLATLRLQHHRLPPLRIRIASSRRCSASRSRTASIGVGGRVALMCDASTTRSRRCGR